MTKRRTSFTQQEMELIAALKGNSGFKLLVESINDIIVDMTDAIFSVGSDKEQVDQLLPICKAMKLVHARLELAPATFAEEVEKLREQTGKTAEADFNHDALARITEELYKRKQNSGGQATLPFASYDPANEMN